MLSCVFALYVCHYLFCTIMFFCNCFTQTPEYTQFFSLYNSTPIDMYIHFKTMILKINWKYDQGCMYTYTVTAKGVHLLTSSISYILFYHTLEIKVLFSESVL